MFLRAFLYCVLTAAVLLPAPHARAQTDADPEKAAQEKTKKSDKLLSADEITNDDTSGTVVARGNVEIATTAQILKAGEVDYEKPKDLVTARDDVALPQEDGTGLFPHEG